MLEKSPTLGSIETSDAIKSQLASKSHEFNLKDKTFCELFPELAENSRRIISDKLATSQKLSANGVNGVSNGDLPTAMRQKLERNRLMGGQGIQGAVINLFFLSKYEMFLRFFLALNFFIGRA